MWRYINQALSLGFRGLPGGSSLARLLAERRRKRNNARLSQLTVEQILAWADTYRARIGGWPSARVGPIPDAPGEKWVNVDQALRAGVRGLPGGDSLSRLLDRHRRRAGG